MNSPKRFKITLCFILPCLQSSNSLVRDIVRYGVVGLYARISSTFGANAVFCCDRFGWLNDDFISGRIMLTNRRLRALLWGEYAERNGPCFECA